VTRRKPPKELESSEIELVTTVPEPGRFGYVRRAILTHRDLGSHRARFSPNSECRNLPSGPKPALRTARPHRYAKRCGRDLKHPLGASDLRLDLALPDRFSVIYFGSALKV
jgi:hypothetical protein